MKKIYSIPVKITSILIIIASIVVAGVFATYSFIAANLGCYAQNPKWYDSYIIWNAQNEQIWLSEQWYDYYQKQNVEPLTISEQDHFNRLTELLDSSSIGLIRVDSQGNKTPIAGFYYIENAGVNEYQKLRQEIVNDEYYYEIYFNPNSGINDTFTIAYNTFYELLPNSYNFIVYVLVSLFISTIAYIVLLIGAGKNKNGELALNNVHRIPFDVITVVFAIAAGILLACAMEVFYSYSEMIYLTSGIGIACFCGIYVLGLIWFHTFIARIRAKSLIKSTLCYKVCSWFFVKIKYIFFNIKDKTISKSNDINFDLGDKKNNLNDFYEKCSNNLKSADIRGKADMLCNSINNMTSNMSITTKICLISIPFILLFELFLVLLFESLLFAFVFLVIDIFIFRKIYNFCLQLIELKNAAEHLAHGDLDYKIPVEKLKGDFRTHAENLNSISDGMAVAVEERLKSERMKYELLTNVSHDIKTPLTSIINYVDLLKSQPMSTPESQEYIEVLDRQSAKLKKLITDLIEVSKATTGNITVNATQMEVNELLTQCIGEYDSRLKEKKLEVIMNTPEQPVSIFADGRLLWRVFDNLLGNIVKYAMPNTRVYIDLSTKSDVVIITLKNISQSKLNISADELKERFVRGDSSRTTEGSGLGLSIAQSLTELMKGQFSIEVDGDLFKIMLKFNK